MIKAKNRWIGTSRFVFLNNLPVKKSWRRIKASWWSLEDVLTRLLENVLKTSWRHKTKVNISILIKTSWRQRRKVSPMRPHQDKCSLGLVSFIKKSSIPLSFFFTVTHEHFDQIFRLFLKTLILLSVKQKFCLLKLL